MKRTLTILVAGLLAWAGAAQAETLCERWGGKGAKVSHPDAIKADTADGGTRLTIDLSALPEGAKVHYASLGCFTQQGRQPKEPVQIVPAGQDKPLTLEPPLWRSFDATGAVQAAVAAKQKKLVLEVKAFEAFDSGRTVLDIRYEAKAPDKLPEQATGVKVVHHDGQTFVMWTEVPAFRPAPDNVLWVNQFAGQGKHKTAEGPGVGFLDKPNLPAISLRTLRDLQGLDSKNAGRGVNVFRVKQVPPIRYRIYRHSERITPQNIHQATLVGEQDPLSAYVENMRRINFQGEFTNQLEVWDSIIATWCYDEYKPVAPGDGLYVHTADKPGTGFYAVTTVEAGTENLQDITPANSSAEAVDEKPAPLRPILQRIQPNHWHPTTMEHWRAIWLAPPLSNIPSRPLQVVTTVPKEYREGWPMEIVAFPTGFNMVDSVNIPPKDSLKLFVEQEFAYFDALCYSNGRGTLKSYRESRVDFFPERHLLAMITWCADKYKPQRSGLHGGFLHFGVRHPEIFGWLSFGAYTESYNFQWAPQSGALLSNLGPRDLAVTVDGKPGWEQYNLAWYLREHPARDIPFLMCISATGKDGGHTSEFGWQDDPQGWAALNAARQTFMAFWTSGSSEASRGLAKIPLGSATVPAFSDCSLNDNPGSGDPYDGDPIGQINAYLLWEPKDAVDQAQRWEMTVFLTPDAPADACTVSITPRHCQAFKPRPDQAFTWTNTSVKDGKVVGTGTIAADKFGLVTLKGVTVSKGSNRLSVQVR